MMLKQQIIGVIQFSLPVIVIYNLYPAFLLHPLGQVLCALLVGLYIWFLSKLKHTALIKSLAYSPTQDHKKTFEKMVEMCDINPKTITLRYAYTGGKIAMTASRTIIIDPVAFSLCDTDAEAIKVKDIFEKHIQHTLTPSQKNSIEATKHIMTPGVEKFIFRHELGHAFDSFSMKKLLSIFMIGTLAALCGIKAAIAMLSFGGITAIFAGTLVGCTADIVFTYMSNLIFTLPAEKRADKFAAQYSSSEEIEEAAQFFVKHQEILDIYRESNSLFDRLPIAIRLGYQHGKKRSAVLLKLAHRKRTL